MDSKQRDPIMRRCNPIQHELLPELRNAVGRLTPEPEKLISLRHGQCIEEVLHLP